MSDRVSLFQTRARIVHTVQIPVRMLSYKGDVYECGALLTVGPFEFQEDARKWAQEFFVATTSGYATQHADHAVDELRLVHDPDKPSPVQVANCAPGQERVRFEIGQLLLGTCARESLREGADVDPRAFSPQDASNQLYDLVWAYMYRAYENRR